MNILEAFEYEGQALAQKELREIRRAQRQDEIIEKWRIATIDQALFLHRRGGQFKYFKIKRGVLFRTIREEENEIEQLVLTNCYRAEVLKGLHNDMGHPGKEGLLDI